MKLGASFFTPEDVGRHLWIVVSNPDKNGNIVLVNLSSDPWRNSTQECAVTWGEHPSVGECFIRCDHARLRPSQGVDELFSKKVLSKTKDAPNEFVRRVQQVLGASPLTPLEVKAALRAQGFIS